MNPSVHRPIWSPRPILLVGLAAAAISTILVFVLGHKSVWMESSISLSLVAAGLFLFLMVGLYRGATLHADADTESATPKRSWFRRSENWDVPLPDGDGSLTGFLIALALWALILLTIVFVAPLVIEGIVLFLAAVIWMFARALRQVFRHAERCRNRFGASLLCSIFYTTLYTGWLFAVIELLYLFHR